MNLEEAIPIFASLSSDNTNVVVNWDFDKGKYNIAHFENPRQVKDYVISSNEITFNCIDNVERGAVEQDLKEYGKFRFFSLQRDPREPGKGMLTPIIRPSNQIALRWDEREGKYIARAIGLHPKRQQAFEILPREILFGCNIPERLALDNALENQGKELICSLQRANDDPGKGLVTFEKNREGAFRQVDAHHAGLGRD